MESYRLRKLVFKVADEELKVTIIINLLFNCILLCKHLYITKLL